MLRHLSRTAVFLLALAANLVLFSLIPLLSAREDGASGLRPPLESVYLTRYTPPPRDREEVFRKPPLPEKRPEPPPRPKSRPQAALDKPRIDLEVPRLSFALNPRLNQGIPVAAPPPVALPDEFESGQVDQPPRPISRVPPVYPYSAKRRGVTGEVVVRFLVDIQGRVQRFKVVRSKPQGVFEESVRRAVGRWRFKPGVHQGRAVPTWVVVPIKFTLSG